MPSERIQRRIDQLLDEADEAVARREWADVRDAANAVLALDHDNQDALTYLEAARHATAEAADRDSLGMKGGSPLTGGEGEGEGVPERQDMPNAAPARATHPSSPALLPQGEKGDAMPATFASGRYIVKRFLGEGGKKRVFLAHDTTLDRD
ncbi:MAG TPA: hypothetical protein VK821_20705, partial [Dehalococcoidia bacterium]|nr:hypothetical protein [Dehalococcoidia bacterium]